MTLILLTGKTGQVGRELIGILQPLGKVIATGRSELDLAQPDTIRQAMREYKPTIVVNAAAYTAVDKAESEPDLAMKVNGTAPGVLAEEAKRANALLVHYSTDYIFDGLLGRPYVEDDIPNPLNQYGKTKLAGERAITQTGGSYLILRTSWLYSDQPPNFVLTMLKVAREKDEIAVVDDQVGSPTWARSLAEATGNLVRQQALARERAGIYHLSAVGYATRYAFAKRIFQLASALTTGQFPQPSLRSIATRDYPLPAARPLNCPTSKEKVKSVFGMAMSHWTTQLEACMAQLLPQSTASAVQDRKA